MEIRKISKENFAIVSSFLFLIVMLNTEFASNPVFYYGCIGLTTLSLFLLVFPCVPYNNYIIWRVLFISWAIFSYFLFGKKNNTGYPYMMDVILQSIPSLVCAILILRGKIKEVTRCFIWAAVITCSYACIKSDLSNFMKVSLGYFTLGTQRWNSNYLGCLASFSMVLLVHMKCVIKEQIIFNKYVRYFCMFVLVCTVLWTGSRTAMIILLLGIMGRIVLDSDNPGRILLNFFIALIIVVVFYNSMLKVPELYEIIGSRMERLVSFAVTGSAEEQSIGWRKEMIEYGLSLFCDHPFLGVGIDGFRIYYGAAGSFHSTYAHNNYVELLADGGLWGFGVYYCVHLTSLYIVLKNGIKKNKNLILLLFTVIIADISVISYQTLSTQYVLCIIISTVLYKCGGNYIFVSGDY